MNVLMLRNMINDIDKEKVKANCLRILKIIWHHPITVAMCNLLVMMALYSLLRLFCFFVDREMFPNMTFAHLMEIMKGGLRFDLTAILYLSSLYIVGMVFPWPIRWRENAKYQRTLRWLFWIPNAIGLICNTIDIVYIPFTDRRTTCTFFSEFSNDNNIGTVMGEGFGQYWFIALTMVIVVVIMALCTRRTYHFESQRTVKFYIRQIIWFVVAIYFSVIGIRGGFGHYTRPITISNAMQYANTPRECALVLNTPFTLIQSIVPTKYVEPKYFTPEELPLHMTPIHIPDSTQTMRTDNVVIFILESFSKEYIGFYNKDLDNYTSYTPFLDSLLEHSITFQNSYASGRKSIDAMPSVLSSIPMLIESYIVTPYSTNAISSVAERLRKKGYYTAFFHGAPNGSMGFQAYARGAGFEDYYGKDEYNGPDAYDGVWAIWDEEFLQYYSRTMSTLKEPFMTAVFTASSHHPFKVPARYRDVFPKGPEKINEPLGYSDNALRQFFKTASQEPWFEHTLFVFTADHTNLLHRDEYNNDRGHYEVPVAFYHPQLDPERRPDIVSQTDIMPSVLGFLGYNEPYFAFGEDALSKHKEHPYAICYNATVFQIFSDSLLVQFDGDHVTAVYNFKNDRCLRHNIVGSVDEATLAPMLDYLKAYIQQYIHCIIHNEMTTECKKSDI